MDTPRLYSCIRIVVAGSITRPADLLHIAQPGTQPADGPSRTISVSSCSYEASRESNRLESVEPSIVRPDPRRPPPKLIAPERRDVLQPTGFTSRFDLDRVPAGVPVPQIRASAETAQPAARQRVRAGCWQTFGNLLPVSCCLASVPRNRQIDARTRRRPQWGLDDRSDGCGSAPREVGPFAAPTSNDN